MSDNSNNKTSILVNSQVPEFVRNEHATFVAFLEYYYKFLEQDGQMMYVSKNFNRFQDIDIIAEDIAHDAILGDYHELREESDYHAFLQKMYDSFIKFIPDSIIADRNLIVKHAKDFYRSTGSEKSVRFLIRALFNKEVSFYYPKSDILRASDGKWFVEKSLKITDVQVNNVSNTIAASIFKNRLIKGLSSNATATVESVDVYFDKGQPVIELKLSGIYKEFQNAEKVFTYYTEEGVDKYLTASLFSGVITAVTLINGGSNYTEGSSVNIASNGSGAQIVVSKVTKGSIQGVGVSYGGAGFHVDDGIVISGGGSGANANVVSVSADGRYHPNSYNVIWSTINLEANTPINNLIYSNLNSNIISPYNDAGGISNSMGYFLYANCGPAVSCYVIAGGNNYTPPLSLTISANSIIQKLGILGRMEVIDGGTGYVANDKIEFVNPIGSTGSGAYANVVSVNATGSIQNVAFISQYGQIVGGSGYDYLNLPKAVVVSSNASAVGANVMVRAVIGHNERLVASNSTIGTILQLTVVSGGTGYIDNPVLRLDQLGDGTANATLTTVTGAYAYPGRYINDDGHISAYNFLEDRDYYQNYSYVVKVDETINKYRTPIKDLIHPAGMKLFGEYLTVDDQQTATNTNVRVSYANTVSNSEFFTSYYQVQDYVSGSLTPEIIPGTVLPEMISGAYTVDTANQIGTYSITGTDCVVYSPAHGFNKNDYVYFAILTNLSANLGNGIYLVTSANTNYLTIKNSKIDYNSGNVQLYNPAVQVTLSSAKSLSANDNVYIEFITTDQFLGNSTYKIYSVSGSTRFKVLHPQANGAQSVSTSSTTSSNISYFTRTDDTTTYAAGVATVTPFLDTNQSIPYNTGVLSDKQVTQDIAMTFTQAVNVGPLWGSATVSRSFAVGEENILMGSGTYFTYLNIGDRIELADAPGGSPIFFVTDITSNTIMSLSNSVPTGITTSKIFKSYKVGDAINLVGKGVTAGGKRSVSVTPSTFTFDLKETLPQDISSNVTYKLATTSVTPISSNVLNYVVVHTNTAIVTATNHGFSTGDRAYMIVSSGDTANVTNGYYTINNVTDNNTINISSQKPITTNATVLVYRKNSDITIVGHAASNTKTVYVTFVDGDQGNTTNGVYTPVVLDTNKFRIKTDIPVPANCNVRVYYSSNLYSNILFTKVNHGYNANSNVWIEFDSASISNGIFKVNTAFSGNTYNIAYNANTYVNTTSNTITHSALGIASNIAMEGTAFVALYK